MSTAARRRLMRDFKKLNNKDDDKNDNIGEFRFPFLTA